MATENTNFRVKNGLDVSGNATINGTVSATAFTGDGSGLTNMYSGSNFSTDFASKDTDDLSEGTTNLYFTTVRAQNAISVDSTLSKTGGQISMPASGVTAASYGSASQVPVITIDAQGRITAASTAAVAGVSSFSYTANTNTYTITTSAGTSFTATGDLSSFDTADLAEGTNLYYTDARWDTRLGTKTTDNLTEGTTNLYFTTVRAQGAITVDATLTKVGGQISLPNSGATAGSYGSGSAVPVITVDAQGRITNITTSAVAGVSNFTYTANTNTYTITTSAGSSFSASGDLSSFDTDDLTEGSTNLYYTTTRWDTRLGTKTTDNLAEGSTNLYYTTARWDTRLGTKTTDNLTEGSTNLYYTNSRARAALSYTSGSAGYDNTTGVITIPTTTTHITEGTNMYFTTARARNSISAGSGVTYDAATGEISVSTTGTTIVNNITSTGDATIGGNVTIGGNLTVSGSTTTVSAKNLAVSDNMIYLNNAIQTTITAVTGNGTTQTYTTSVDHNYTANMVVTVLGVDPSGYNCTNQTITAVTANTFSIAGSFTGTYVSGGTARAKSSANPDLGIAGSYNDGTYHHAGFFRDATDGYWKVFQGYTPEPDNSVFIDTTDASFALADIQAANFRGALVGNASTATTLATSRNINGTAFNGSADITITANTTNTLTIGTGLSGTSFNGSSAVTIAIDSTVATLTGSQVLTNKTLTDSTTYFQDDADNTKKMQFQLSGITASNTRTLTVPDTSGTIALTGNKLSAFAATTSAELAGVISDETGSGALVFGTSPSFTTDIRTPKVTTSGATNLVLDTNAGTTTGSITIAAGANGNISLVPNGTGSVITGAAASGTLTTSGASSNLTLSTNGGTNSGTIVITAGTNGNITLTPNGTGVVSVSGTGVKFSGSTSGTITLLATATAGTNTITMPATTGTVAMIDTTQVFTGDTTFRRSGVGGALRAEAASTNDAIILSGRVGGTSSFAVRLIPGTLTASRTLTLPDTTGTVITTGDTGTVTNDMLAGSIANAKLSNSSITINGTAVSLGGTITVSVTESDTLATVTTRGNTTTNNITVGTLDSIVHQNADTAIQVTNNNTGGSATAQFFASNGTNRTQFFHTGTSYSGTGILSSAPGLGGIYNTTAQGIALVSSNAAGVIKFATGTGNVERARIDSNGIQITSNAKFVSPDGTKNQTIRMLDTDTLTFSGSAGQLFSVSNSLTGTIFAVNDVSGMPSIEVYDTGQIRLAELTGNVLIGTPTDNTTDKVQITGSARVSTALGIGGSAGTAYPLYVQNAQRYQIGLKNTNGTNYWWLAHDSNDNFVLHANALGDRWTISSSGNITPVGWQRMGTFSPSQSNTGEAWIGRATDRSTGTMTVQLGNDAARVFEVVDNAWSTVIFNAGMNSFLYKGSTIWHAGNDGASSGLDADLLDGNHASAFALSSHTHAASDITSGVFATARLASSGTASSSTFLRGDQTWAAISLANSVTFTSSGGGAAGTTYNGGSAVTVDYSTVGAAPASHTHSYLSAESDTLATVTGRGATTSTVTSFTGGGGDGSPALRITQTAGASSFNWLASFLNSGINGAAGRNAILLVGQAESSKNSAYFGFNWASNSSNSNFLTLGMYGADNLMNIFGNGNVAIGTTSDAGYKLNVNGSFAATTKSFLIPHPTKEGWKLRYGSLEGPENGVYIRGKLKGENVIELPDYWTKLVDPDSITVQLTAIGKHQKLYVEDIRDNKVYVANDGLFAGEINCFYYVQAERVDVEKLVVEYKE